MVQKQTVGMLKKHLERYDDDLLLAYSHDDEGNAYQHIYFTPSKGVLDENMRMFYGDTDKDKPKGLPKVLCIN